MRPLAASIALALLSAPAGGESQQQPPKQWVTYCAYDGVSAFIPYNGEKIGITHVGDDQLKAAFDADNRHTPTFWLEREGKAIFSFTADDLSSGSIWVAVPRDLNTDRFAVTYSDGGAVGGWHVLAFRVERGKVTDISGIVKRAVADFSSRYRCAPDDTPNVEALKWIKGDLLLITQLLPDTICSSPDRGHLEAYLVSVPDGAIRQHLTEAQLKTYLGVCFQNEDGN